MNSTKLNLRIMVLAVVAFTAVNSLSLQAQQFAGGSGTENDPYQVATAVHLDSVRHFRHSFFIQTADIDLNVAPFNTGEGWPPLFPDEQVEFTGTYDGNGYIISNLYINSTNIGRSHGLFSRIKSLSDQGVIIQTGTLKNITLLNPSVTAPNNAGGLIGNPDDAIVINCRVIGGSVTATGNNFVAGTAGALAGRFEGQISGSYSIGVTVTASDPANRGSANAGGLAGSFDGYIINSYAINTVNGEYAGGLMGFDQSNGIPFINNYSASVVTGSLTTGGLIGAALGTPSITASYYNSDSTTSSNSYGEGLTTTEMRQRASFTDWDLSDTWFIDEGAGFPGLLEQKGNYIHITGDEGWRMLTSPLQSKSIGTLLSPLWTQGFTGADTTGGASNLYFWNEATRSWSAPSDTTAVPAVGTGFLMYVYSDDNADGTPEGFPKRLSQSGTVYSGQQTLNLSYTNSGTATNDGWNLIGNPYPTSVNWSASQGWARDSLDLTFYVWSDSASNGNGAYLTWNTMGIGTKGNGKIAPWQGFWVKANGSTPQIVFSDTVRNAGGVLLKQAPVVIPQLNFEVSGSGGSSKTVVMFHKDATPGKDAFDAYKLQSLNKDDYLLLGTSINGGQVMDIQALPFSETLMELDLVLEGSDMNGEFTLSWNSKDFPEEWNAELTDTQTREIYPLAGAGSHRFSMQQAKAASKKSQEKEQLLPASPVRLLTKAKNAPNRFMIRMKTATSGEPDPGLPTNLELFQNYPNPFNPVTTITYNLPDLSRVRLEVFDMLGRNVATLVESEQQQAGRYQVSFDASRLASGMYMYRLQAGNAVFTKKLTLIK